MKVRIPSKLLTRQSPAGVDRRYPKDSSSPWHTERDYVALFDSLNHYRPVEYRWVKVIGNFA